MAAAASLPDYLRPGLRIVFVGINPGRRSGAIGHHYAGVTNQFWRLLREAGLTPTLLGPEEDARVLEFGLGLTNIVSRMTPSSSDLSAADFAVGAPILAEKLHRCRPRIVCFNGKIIGERLLGPCRLGLQRRPFAGCRVFVVPSSSAANAAVSYARKLGYFRRLARLARTDDQTSEVRSQMV